MVCGSNNKHYKDTCSKEIGLSLTHVRFYKACNFDQGVMFLNLANVRLVSSYSTYRMSFQLESLYFKPCF